MENIKSLYSTMFNDSPTCWKYYQQGNYDFPFDSSTSSLNFIKQYIEDSGKGSGNPLFQHINEVETKAQHIVSLFFLGILLYKKNNSIRTSIDNQIIKLKNQHQFQSEVNFAYIWFLMSLFHDLGMYYEEIEDLKDIKSIYKKYKIEHKVKNINGIPTCLKQNWKKYFLFKKNHIEFVNCNNCDHGIIGGIILYDSLLKLYNQITKIGTKTTDGHIHKNLYWSEKLFPCYNIASSAILAHNIYFRIEGKDNIEPYRGHELKDLIILKNHKPKINFDKHPFLALLCLTDTIEPFKILETKSFNDLKEYYQIKADNTKIKIRAMTANKGQIANILDLKYWLNLKITQIDYNTLEIEI